MLASAAVGTVEYRSMTEPVRVTNPFIDNFVEGRAVGIDVVQQKLNVQLTSLSTFMGTLKGTAVNAPDRLVPVQEETTIHHQQQQSDSSTSSTAERSVILNYDFLICAVGTSVRSSIVPGAKEYCFNLKTTQDSKRLRTAIGEALEYVSNSFLSLYIMLLSCRIVGQVTSLSFSLFLTRKMCQLDF